MVRTKVAIVHSLMTPYRVPLFQRFLDDHDLEVRIFVNDRPSPNRPTFKGSEITDDERVIRLPEIGFPAYKRGDEKIRFNTQINRVFTWKPDVVVVYGYNEPTNLIVLLMCILRRVPFVLLAEVGPQEKSSQRRFLFSPFLGLLIRRAAGLGAASDSCRDFFLSLGADPVRISKIPCMPDVSGLIATSSGLGEDGTMRRRFNLENKFVVVFLGRFLACKGIDEMFEALDIVTRDHHDVVLMVAGYGTLEEHVKLECDRRAGNCIFYGIVKDHRELCTLFSAADIHVMPSWYEGFGVVAAEALSCGLPTIVTKSSGCIDLIREGVNGLIIDPRDARALATAIAKVHEDHVLLSRMRSEARRSVEDLNMDALYKKLKTLVIDASRR